RGAGRVGGAGAARSDTCPHPGRSEPGAHSITCSPPSRRMADAGGDSVTARPHTTVGIMGSMKFLDADRAPALIRTARLAAGYSQAELARRAGLRQSHVAAMESGRRPVSAEMLGRVLRAARYRPSIPL